MFLSGVYILTFDIQRHPIIITLEIRTPLPINEEKKEGFNMVGCAPHTILKEVFYVEGRKKKTLRQREK
jgi:hypothetical protein